MRCEANETSGVQWQYNHLNVFLLKKAEVSLGFLTELCFIFGDTGKKRKVFK
jgi:hypothetical protein